MADHVRRGVSKGAAAAKGERVLMQQRARKPEMASSEAQEHRERERRQAMVEDAGKTEDKDRDLVHGDGGTLGLGSPEDLSHDD